MVDPTTGTKGPANFRKSFYSSTLARNKKLQQQQQLPLAKYDMGAEMGLDSSFTRHLPNDARKS